MSTAADTSAERVPLAWSLSGNDDYTLAEFVITGENGVLDPADLARIDVPKEAPMHKGIILSGRGPVWLYGYLVHRAHPYAWVGIFDPRLQAAVVIERHVQAAPHLGKTMILNEGNS